MIDSMINPLMILLILSMITEKFSEFLKLHLFELAIEKPKGPEEDRRQTTIQTITIFTGIGVALVARANLFEIFNKDFTLFWDQIVMGDMKLYYISSILGSMFTGLFLSLGSKFFHDLLSLLFEVKNFKKKLNDKSDWEFQSMKAVDEYTERDELEYIQQATESLRSELKNIENIVSVSVAFQDYKPVLYVYANKNFTEDSKIQDVYSYTEHNGIQKEIDVILVRNYEPTLHATLLKSGEEISNCAPYPNNAGSLGGRVIHRASNRVYFLTCYHVVKSPKNLWSAFNPNVDPFVLHALSNQTCGQIVYAKRDGEVDIAVIKPAGNVDVSPYINGIGTPSNVRAITSRDVVQNSQVKMFGLKSGLTFGNIIHFQKSIELPYFADPTIAEHSYILHNMIVIQARNRDHFSLAGDSGSFIVDSGNNLIGILVGGDANLSFAMPIETVFARTNTKLR